MSFIMQFRVRHQLGSDKKLLGLKETCSHLHSHFTILPTREKPKTLLGGNSTYKHRCSDNSKQCIWVRRSSYRIEARARGLFTGIIVPRWNKLQILVKRSKYSPFGDKGSTVRLFCTCNGTVSQSARGTKLHGYFAPRQKGQEVWWVRLQWIIVSGLWSYGLDILPSKACSEQFVNCLEKGRSCC